VERSNTGVVRGSGDPMGSGLVKGGVTSRAQRLAQERIGFARMRAEAATAERERPHAASTTALLQVRGDAVYVSAAASELGGNKRIWPSIAVRNLGGEKRTKRGGT